MLDKRKEPFICSVDPEYMELDAVLKKDKENFDKISP